MVIFASSPYFLCAGSYLIWCKSGCIGSMCSSGYALRANCHESAVTPQMMKEVRHSREGVAGMTMHG